MYSTPLKGTNTKKIKLSWFDYYFSHCWMTGWQSIRGAFRIWADLMGSNYKDYALPRTVEDPEAECIEWFWVTLGEDEVYPKEFLEYLLQMCADIDSGKVETFPLTEDFFDRLKDLVKDVDPEDENETN
jgi:hypothetical protein